MSAVKHTKDDSLFKGAFKSLGVVFGDIGTSPIYTLTVIFLILKPTHENVISILSLIFWTLFTLVTVKYVWLAMSLSRRGEGGDVVLLDILTSYMKKGRGLVFVSFMAYISISLMIGDGIITPAISILSAVEGIKLIPRFEHIPQGLLVLLASIIAIVLLSFQKRGTDKVAKAFSPIMLIWFMALGIYGLIYISECPDILMSISPHYGIRFLFNHGWLSFLILSDVILCATGGEAVYADMGHLGRKPITYAWGFVCVALLLNYFGQGAYMLKYNTTHNLLFGMVFDMTKLLYIPFLVLSIMATVIASQAMISGIFSMVYQAINLRILPLMRIDFTSARIKGQIYISTVNWFLLFFIVLVILQFKTSENLAAAYGIAVTGTVFLAGIMMAMIFYIKRMFIKFAWTVFVTIIAGLFFASTTLKIPNGGYWSILIACIPFAIMLIYMEGQKRLFKLMNPVPLDRFLLCYNEAYQELPKIRGTGIYLIRDEKFIPPYVLHTMIKNQIIYEDNIFVSINRKDGPWGVSYGFKKPLAEGLRVFEVKMGYMEMEDIEKIFRVSWIKEKAIFYGIEDIYSTNLIWKIFAMMKLLLPSYVRFYNLPASELHGVTTKINM